MDFVHPKSSECMKSELDLFSIPPTQVSLEKGKWIDHLPVSSLADNGPITFLSPGTEDYVDLSKTILVVSAKVTKPDGTDLDIDTKVGPITNFLHSMFKQVDIFLKEKQVTQATGTYAYRSFLETILNYGISAKQSQLTAALFYKDTAGAMDAADPSLAGATANEGLKKRYNFIKSSGIVEMAGPIFCDMFFTERLLLSYVDLRVVMNRSNNAFCLMSSVADAGFKVSLVDAYLKVRKVKVNPSIAMAHEIALKKSPAFYPLRRVGCKRFIIPAGNPSLQKDNVFNGFVPKSFVFGLVESAGFNGNYKKNPFNFKHFNMSSLSLTVNGEAIPFKPIQLSFGANKKFIEAYYTQFSGTGKMYHNTGNGISREEFAEGYAIYAFDLTGDMCSASSHFNLVQKGNLSVEIQFSVEAVSLVCYGVSKILFKLMPIEMLSTTS